IFCRVLPEAKKAKLCPNLKKNYSLLNDTERELFQTFSDAHGNMNRIAIADSFVDGFGLGMRIAIEVTQKSL
ncbi:MAG TPA: hypothetical protein DCM73_10250, partial [Clostridiales bacterium]|nr:hypothetical protein [Clostridiales bacterium]